MSVNTVLSLGGFDNAVPEGEEGCVVPGFLMNVVSCAIDANKDGQVDVNDAVFILNVMHPILGRENCFAGRFHCTNTRLDAQAIL
eukprot:scaffold2910_cov390-Prasinococcus_capsulatus_cf.AAC.12